MDNLLSELQLQRDCFIWSWNQFPETRGLLFHVTNEVKPMRLDTGNGIYLEETQRQLSIRIAKMKAAGLVAGVADLVFLWNPVYCFELKVGKNNTSKEQQAFAKQVEDRGHHYCIIRDLDTFKKIFTSLVTNKAHICQY